MARSIAFEDLATEVYVRVDDWYQAHAAGGRRGQAGAKPLFSDSEVITLLLPVDFLPFPGETQFLGFVRANHLSLFPRLPGQSQFNRRARCLWPRIEELRRHWAEALGATRTSLYLLDTKPLPVVGYKRCKDRSDFAATADYGVCASRHLKYFGYKLVLLCTPAGGARGLRPGAGLDGRAGGGRAGPGLGLAGPHPRRQGLHRGRLATGLPGDPGAGDPDPGAPQPAHGPAARL